jgi:hypothetical protein
MKTCNLNIGLVLWSLLGGGYTAVAQPASPPLPIVVRITEIDRSGVTLLPIKGTGLLGVPYNAMACSNVWLVVSNGMRLNQPVLIMDGEKLIGRSSLFGMFESNRDPWASWDSKTRDYTLDESGLALRFESPEEAKRVWAALIVDQNIKERVRYYRKHFVDNNMNVF